MWGKAKDLARLFKRELATYQSVLADSRTPVGAKIFLGLAVGYLCMPFDLIPDFIPVIGPLHRRSFKAAILSHRRFVHTFAFARWNQSLRHSPNSNRLC